MDELEPNTANLRGYLQVIWRRLPWLLAVTVLSVAVAVALVTVQKKEYSATADLLVQAAGGSVPGTQQTITSTDLLTEIQLVMSAPVKQQVIAKLGFIPKVSVAEVGQTNVIGVEATERTPALAAEVANTYAKTFVAYQQVTALKALTAAEQQLQEQITAIDKQLTPLEAETSPSAGTTSTISALSNQETVLKEQLAQLQVSGAETPGGVELVSPAILPTSPSSPKPVRDGAIALVLGLLLGLGAAAAAEYFDDKVYTKDEAERLTGGVPVLALIPQMRRWKSRQTKLIAQEDPMSPVTESYRALRTSLQFAAHEEPLKTILVTSATGAEGKTSTAANLGVVLANAGERVVVVSSDLRRPRIGQFLGQAESPGFTSVLLGRESLISAIQPIANTDGLALLGSGPIPPNPADLLGSAKATEIFAQLAADFDVVVIDSPPLLVSDTLVLSSYADAVLLVVAAGETKKGQLERATELLDQVNARPMGIVLNKVVRRSKGGLDYTYRYKYNTKSPPGLSEIDVTQNGHQPLSTGATQTAAKHSSSSAGS